MAKFGTFSDLNFKYGTVNVASIFKGANKVYDANRLQPSLLMHFDGLDGSTVFRDDSGYGHVVTANGNAQISTTQSKFGGSSAYFDGTGDYLTIPDNDSFEFGSGDFTVEMFVYRNGSQAAFAGLVSFSEDGGNGLVLGFGNGDNKLRLVASNAQQILASTAMTDATWTHVAVVRNGSTITCYQAGVSVGTYNIGANALPFSAVGMAIGRLTTNTDNWYFNGYIDDLRIIKGEALYTSNFNPPSSPHKDPIFAVASGGTETYYVDTDNGLPYKAHTFTDADPTSLLLNFDGANGSTTFTDDSGWGHTVTANGNAAISTTQSKFGGSSLALDGTGDYLELPQTGPLNVQSGDFTIEGWLYLSALPGAGTTAAVVTLANNASNGYSAIRLRVNSSGNFELYMSANGSSWEDQGTSSNAISTSTWTHFSIVRNGSASGNVTFYLNGTSGLTLTSASSLYIGGKYLIGTVFSSSVAGEYFNGYIDSLRIVKGQALYTSNFTPSTTALTRVGSGSLNFTRGGVVDYLVVGGGGGGTGTLNIGAGGGAGGVLAASTELSIGTKSVAVGNGGAAGWPGENGSDSKLDAIEALGGGYGAQPTASGGSGGSGGGGGHFGGTGGSGTSGQGNDGGDGITTSNQGAGGGGGASAAGGNASGLYGGNGGNGISSSISGSATSYGGGGGGGFYSVTTGTYGGTGGTGGGGDAGPSNTDRDGRNGTANTGGGGGGASRQASPDLTGTGGSGGSGIVIVRYRITEEEFNYVSATGGTETYIEDGNTFYKVHTFTDVGTSSLTFTRGGAVEYLVVAGGGGSGGIGVLTAAGAGGAGGLLTNIGGSPLSLSAGNFVVTVGAGGGGGGFNQRGLNGDNSIFDTLTAVGGGGGGGGNANQNGGSGGSGGGGGTSGTGGAGTTGQGNAGGNQWGGGGGAAQSGSDGGQGLLINITGTSTYYAGGGQTPFGSTPVLGGGGRGDAGENAGLAQNGTPNTGGGAGARWGSYITGKSGGSGIVIVRYPISKSTFISNS